MVNKNKHYLNTYFKKRNGDGNVNHYNIGKNSIECDIFHQKKHSYWLEKYGDSSPYILSFEKNYRFNINPRQNFQYVKQSHENTHCVSLCYQNPQFLV